MLAGFAAKWGISAWVLKLVLAGILAGAVTATYVVWRNNIWNQGYAVAKGEWEAAAKKERERLEEINRRSRESQRRSIEELNAEKKRLEAENEKLQQDADKDAGADRISLPRDSVRRINRIR